MLEVFTAVQRSGSSEDVFELIEELDLSLTQFKLLTELAALERPCSIKQAGACVGLSLPAASRSADVLVRRGLLERQEDPEDRRIKRLTLTAKGAEAAGRIRAARLAGLESFVAPLDPAERRHLATAIRSLLRTATPDPSAPHEDPTP